MKKYLLPILLMSLMISCVTREICDDNNQSELVARFKLEMDGVYTDTVFNGVSVYGTRSGQEFNLLYDSVPTSRIVLPLDPNQTSTSFLIDFNGLRDTLTIQHTTEYYLISYTCGFAALFTMEDVAHTRQAI
ncbi:MAG: DUF6452 family protein, partial [Anaerolineales bacterium]